MAEEPKAEDEAPPAVDNHPFEPRGAWWSLCKVCGLARAAHSSSTIDTRREMFLDQMKRYGKINHVDPARSEQLTREFEEQEAAHVEIGYYSDDVPDDE